MFRGYDAGQDFSVNDNTAQPRRLFKFADNAHHIDLAVLGLSGPKSAFDI